MVRRCTHCDQLKSSPELRGYHEKCEDCRESYWLQPPTELEAGFKSILRQQEEQIKQSDEHVERLESGFDDLKVLLESILHEQRGQSNYLDTMAKKQEEVSKVPNTLPPTQKEEAEAAKSTTSQAVGGSIELSNRLVFFENIVNKLVADVEELKMR